MKEQQAYIVSQRTPYHWLSMILLAVLITIAVQWLVNQQLNHTQHVKLIALNQQNLALIAKLEEVQASNQQLAVEVNDQQHQLAMSKVTDQQLRVDLEQLQNKVISLNKELLFYQNITQGSASSELQIRELQLSPVKGEQATFHYQIVLTQGKKITQPITGTLTVNLQQANDMREIKQHAVKFRHVQVLEGTIKLDENEYPTALFIQLKQGKKNLTKRTFEWIPESAETL